MEKVKEFTVYCRYAARKKLGGVFGKQIPFPEIRMCGLWLRFAGFDIGDHYTVTVEKNSLTIQKIETNEQGRNKRAA